MKNTNSPNEGDGIATSSKFGIELKKKNGKLCVGSRFLSKRMDVDHKSVVNSLTKHSDYFIRHGDYIVFKIRDKSKSGREKEAFLTEDQAYFLLSLSRNTEKVVQLKSDLVQVFSKLRRKHQLLINRTAKLEYQQNRTVGIFHRRTLTDDIKPFIEYAKSQGSKGSHFLYINISKWINKACYVESIEIADEHQLANISTACDIALQVINDGMTKNDSYKIIKASMKAKLSLFGEMIGGKNDG